MSGFTQIGVGTTANDGTGDALRTAMQAVNSNYASTVRAIASTSSLASEAAASGYVRLVYDDLGSQTFVADNTGLTVDNIKVFASATVGWTWVRSMPAWVDITSPRFRCIGDDSTDCTTNLQAAADFAFANNLPLRIPAGTYKVTDFINFYDLVVIGDGRERAVIKSYSANKPVGVMQGAHGNISRVTFQYDSIKTDKNCSCLLVTGVTGGGSGGYYWGSLRDVGLLYGNYGIHTVGQLSTTLSSGASSGGTSIEVATVSSGNFDCIVAGGYITITLDSGTQNVQVDYVSGTTVHLKTALTGNASSGNAVSVYETVFFSNTLDNIYCRYWNDYAFLHNGSGTGCKMDNIYMGRGESNTYEACKGYMYLGSFNDSSMGQINCEWAEISGNAISIYAGDTMAIDSLHCEGVKFGASNLSYISTTMPSLNVCAWTIDDWVVPSASATAALIRVENTTTHSPNVKVDNLSIRQSKIYNVNSVYFLNNLTGENCYVYIDGYSPKKDSGIKTSGQIVTPSTKSCGLRRLQPYFDDSVLAYGFKTNLSGVTDISCYATKHKASFDQILFGNSENSLSTATVELRTATGGGGTEILASTALSDLTGPLTYKKSSNAAGVDSTVFDFSSDGKIYLRVTASQSAVSVSGSSVSVQRFDDASNGYGVNRITWGSSHGVAKGEVITISGATDTSFNGTFIVLDVTSTTIDFYKYTGNAVASTADTGISISRLPIVDVIVKGNDWGKPIFT